MAGQVVLVCGILLVATRPFQQSGLTTSSLSISSPVTIVKRRSTVDRHPRVPKRPFANVEAAVALIGSTATLSLATPALALDVPSITVPRAEEPVQEARLPRLFPAGLDAPPLDASVLPQEFSSSYSWPTLLRWVALATLGPALATFRYLRRNEAFKEPAFEDASFAYTQPAFDPMGLSVATPTVLAMSSGPSSKGERDKKEASRLTEKDAQLGGRGSPPKLYSQRWIQLAYVSLFALISDWVCFSVAAAPGSWERTFGHDPAELVDLFLFTNVFSCFFYTDVADYFGLRKVIVGAGALMAAGCVLRSGIPFDGSLPSYEIITLGTVFVGAAQPFFQCSPPLLSATWFGANERALATATAINFNQVGIAMAFLVGGVLGQSAPGLATYFSIITVVTVLASAGSFIQFRDRPPSAPSASAAIREASEKAAGPRKFSIQFPATAVALLKQNEFRIPLVGFVASIGVTNIISTFTDSSLRRAGFLDTLNIDLSGAAFQVAIVLGGVFVGGYVDRTKRFKVVTLACLIISLVMLLILSVAFGNDINLPQWVVLTALLGVGATLGPVQPINAELAVEATYPSDENAIEAVQQLCGNLFSALLVPLCGVAAGYDFDLLGKVDVRGDSVVVLALLLFTIWYYSTFDAPLRRAELDNALPLREE